jgi:hypothetical protein
VLVSTNAANATNTGRLLYLRIKFMLVLLCSDLTYEANEDGGGYSVGFECSLALFVYSAILPYFILIPRNRVLLEKLVGSQLVKKFPAFYGTRRFITALARARHLSLS